MMLTKPHLTRSRGGVLPRRLSSFLLAIAAAAAATTARAQEYRVDKPDEVAKRNAAIAQLSVKNAARYAADRQKVDDYFANYYFKEMTSTAPNDLARLGDSRYNLFKRYIWATDNEQLQQHLTDLAFKQMRQVVVANNPPYHPSVRYNAVLILGMLDEQYAIETGPNRRPPRTHAAARAILVQIVNAAAEGKAVPPVLTLGALVGLERHAQFRDSLEPADVQAITAALLKLVNHQKPLQEMDRETYDWLRMQAAEILAELGNVGPKNQVYDALLKLTGNFKSLDDRTAAAALLSKLEFEGAKVDGKAAVEQVFKLARDIGKAESERAAEFQNARLQGGGGFAFRGGEGRFMQGLEGETETFPRRHVLARLIDLRAALRAVKPLVAEDAQEPIDALLKALQPAINAAANKDIVELKLAAEVNAMAAAIERIAAPAPEATDEEKAAEEF